MTPTPETLKEVEAALNEAREYIALVKRIHWPQSILAANTLHTIDAALARLRAETQENYDG